MRQAKKEGLLDDPFIERIMLAVTEVNGCEICSYGHTKMALEIGMDEAEIKKLLTGDTSELSLEEVPAIVFAQHYADTRGVPSEEAWEKIVDYYGKPKALGILGAIRAIMVGNAYGIALSALRNRLRGKPITKGNLFGEEKMRLSYELTMILSLIVYLPIALIQIIVANIMKAPIIQFK
jgi:AhpD family alkylhydroperoxidase